MVLLAGLPVRAEDANPVLAKVNGAEIRQSDVALAEEELGPSLAQMDPATKKDNVLSFLIDMKIVAKAAEDKKVENNEDFKKRLAFTRNRLLMDSLLATEGKAATTDEAMKKVYEDASKQITGEQEVHARHILVETEDEAKAVEEELKKGADFAELAKKKSKDPGASDGGDLGFFTKDQMVPEFSAVAFALEPGKISDPVKSQFGWHIIKVEEKRNRKAPDFEQVKGQIETYVTRKAQADYVAKLREAAKVERMDQADADGEARRQAGCRQARRLQDGAGEEVKIRCHFFEANSIYKRHGRACPGHLRLEVSSREDKTWMAGTMCGHDELFPATIVFRRIWPMSISRLPARPDRCPRHARDRGRQACDGGRGHPLQGPHRRAAGGDGQGDGGRRRLHPVEMPVGAGGMVPRQARQGGKARALVVNSGNANAFTGKTGRQATALTASIAAKALGCSPNEVFLASTGVIGEPLDATKFDGVLGTLAEQAAPGDWMNAAKAIMTTDTFPKVATATVKLGKAKVTINGMAKGAGMIAPDMATMLAFVFTDAPIAAGALQSLLKSGVEDTFNAVTIDGDTSTSDTLLAFATGAAAANGAPKISRASDPRLKAFAKAFHAVLADLAEQVARDGEGARKLVEIIVEGAMSKTSARKIAMSVANSPLVKTAIAGEDANWGRVVMAVGKAGEPANRDKLSISFNGIRVARRGARDPSYDEAEVSEAMKNPKIQIKIALGLGKGRDRVLTCDLTKEYVAINGDYRS